MYKELIERLRDPNNCNVLDDVDAAADVIEKLDTLTDNLIKEVLWLKSCKNCKIYADCPRHGAKTVHGCDHWVDVCGERKDNG